MPPAPDWEPVLARATRVLARASSADDVAREALGLLVTGPDVVRAGVALEEGAGRRLRFLPTERLATDRPAWCEIDGLADVPLVRALLTGRPVLLRSLEELRAQYPHLAERQRSLGTRALAALPLEDQGDRLGAMLIAFDEPQQFGDEQVVALLEVARATARAMRTVLAPAGPGAQPPSALPAGRHAWTRVDPSTVAPRKARHFLRDRLEEWGAPRDVVDRAELCLSEVVTNAVLHARTPVGVLVALDDDRLRVVIEDGGRDQRVRRRPVPEPDDVGGRGLMLVDELSSEWGSEQSVQGTRVWFEVETRGSGLG